MLRRFRNVGGKFSSIQWTVGLTLAVSIGAAIYVGLQFGKRDPGPIVAGDGSGPRPSSGNEIAAGPAPAVPVPHAPASVSRSPAAENATIPREVRQGEKVVFVPLDPNTKWEPRYVRMEQLGTPDEPQVRSPDGKLRRLTPMSVMKQAQEQYEQQENTKPFRLEERLKNPSYLNSVFPEKSTSLFPMPAGVDWLYSQILGIADAWASPPPYYLISQETAITDQQDRDTCWIFATVAGIESTYLQQWGTYLSLSEQFANHVAKSTGITYPLYYQYENQSSYWGGGNSWAGTSALYQYTIPAQSSLTYPAFGNVSYLNQEQMTTLVQQTPGAGPLIWQSAPSQNTNTQANVDAFEYNEAYIPFSARQAAQYGITNYTTLSQSQVTNTSTLESLISSGRSVILDVNLQWQYNSSTGIYEWDANASPAGHVFLLVGYDRTNTNPNLQYFIVKNSWGGSTYTKVTYNFITQAAGSGAIVESVISPSTGTPQRATWIGEWNMDHDGWLGTLIIRRLPDVVSDAAIRWGHWIMGSTIKVANGYNTDSGRGIVFYLDNTAQDQPGSLVGQRFQMWKFSWDPHFMGGSTVWNNTSYGSMASRDENVPHNGEGVPFTTNSWLGTWRLNHDGWIGNLQITGLSNFLFFTLVSGTYYPLNSSPNTPMSVTGMLQLGDNQIANLYIGGQPFTLYRYSWESGMIAGTATWNGAYYGAYGERQ